MSSKEGFFPILDRRAPILERVRNGRVRSLGSKMARKLDEFLREEDEELKEEELARIQTDFRDTLARRLGVEPEMISESIIRQSTSIFTRSEEDILVEGAPVESKDEDSEDEEEDSNSLFAED